MAYYENLFAIPQPGKIYVADVFFTTDMPLGKIIGYPMLGGILDFKILKLES